MMMDSEEEEEQTALVCDNGKEFLEYDIDHTVYSILWIWIW